MNETELTKITGEHTILRRDLLTMCIGAAAFTATALLWRRKRGIPPDPPPIIIKSGSFDIETDKTLTETSGSTNIYKRIGFGEIKGVRVFRTNEVTGSANSDDFEDRNGVEVDIRLQKFTGGVWNDINPLVTIRTEVNAGNPKDFTLRIGKKLAKKGHPKPGRVERWGDNGIDNIRFGKIVVREKDGGGDTFDAEDGDDYIITFYNKLD